MAIGALVLVLSTGVWVCGRSVVRNMREDNIFHAMGRNIALMEAVRHAATPLQQERSALLHARAAVPHDVDIERVWRESNEALRELVVVLEESSVPAEIRHGAAPALQEMLDSKAGHDPAEITAVLNALLRLDRAAAMERTTGGVGKIMVLAYELQYWAESAALLEAGLAPSMVGEKIAADEVEELSTQYHEVRSLLTHPSRLAIDRALARIDRLAKSPEWLQVEQAVQHLHAARQRAPTAEATRVAAAANVVVEELRVACGEELDALRDRLHASGAEVRRQFWFSIASLLAILACGAASFLGVRRLQRALATSTRLQGELEHARDYLAQFRRALDQQSALTVTDANGVIIEVNDRFCESSGFRRDELIGRSHRQVKSPRHSPEFYQRLWATIGAGKIWSGEMCNLSKEGRETYFDTTIKPVPGPDGRPVQYIAIRNDVTERKRLALELERLALVAQKSTVAMVLTDPSGRIEWANSAFETLTGYALADLQGRLPAQLLQGADTDPAAVEIIHGNHAAGRAFEVELLQYRRDGSSVWVHVKSDPVLDSAGQVQRFVAVVVDITARRRVESLTTSIRDSAAYVLMATDPQGVIELFNRGAAELLGYTAEEVVGESTPLQFHLGEELDRRAQVLGAELGRPVTRSFDVLSAKPAAFAQPDENEWTYQRKDGSHVPVRLVTTAMRDHAGRITGFLLLASDISAQREAMERLRRSEERWQLAVAGSNDGAWEWDILTDLMWMSQRDREIFDMAAEGEFIVREHWYSLIHPEDVAGMREAVRRYIDGETDLYEDTYRVRRGDGQWRWVHSRARAVFDPNGRPLRMLGTHTDVTASRMLQDLLRESEARLLEAQAVAHIGSWSLDAQSRVFEWSEETGRILGLAFRHAPMPLALRLCPPAARSTLRAALGLALARGEGSQFDLLMGGGARRSLWVRVTIRAEELKGRVVRIFGTVQDITALYEAESLRREAAQRLDKIAAQVPGVVFQFVRQTDRTIRMPYASSGVATYFGCTPEQLAVDARPLLEAIDEADREQVYDSVRKSAEFLSPWICEFRLRRSDGSLSWFFGNARPEALSDGGVMWHGFITEVTARKEVEARLREQEIFLQELYSGIELPICVVDVAGGNSFRFASVNPSFERLLGAPAAAVVGRGPRELDGAFPAELGRQFEDHFRDCLLAGTTINYEEQISLSGRDRWWLSQLKPVRDPAGRITRLIGSAIEITERMEMEQRLRESEERFFLIARATSDAVWDFDPASGCLWWSDGVTRLFGYEQPGPAAGLKWWLARVHPEDQAGVDAAFTRVLRSTDERWENEYRFLHADGRSRYVQTRALILRGSGGRAIRVVGGMVDITEQRAVREQMRLAREAAEAANTRLQESVQRANQLAREAAAATVAKSEFLANMSHEIRTPLNAIIGMGGLILGTELSEQQREFAETIRLSGDSLLSLINDILDFSKIESGSLELDATPFGVHDCVESALEVLGARAGEKRLDLLYWVDPAVPEVIVGDVTRLRQVLVNLVGNAVKFTGEGEVQVDVEKIPGDGPAVRLRFTVRDTGIGIPPDRMDRLFKSFSQVDASTTRKFGGTGLGLAISRRLVELMQGRIWVESEVGHGSRFIFEVVVGEGTAGTVVSGRQMLADHAGRRVLVVEDNMAARGIIERLCTAWGLVPVGVAGTEAALATLQAGTVDLIVADQQLPDLDGVALVRRLRELPGAAAVPVLLISRLDAFGRLPADLGGVAQLPKPLKVGPLRDALAHALGAGSRPATPAEAPSPPKRHKLGEDHPLSILLAEDNVTNQRVAQLILGRFGFRADIANNGLEALSALERRQYDVVFLDVQMPEMDGLTAARQIHLRFPAERHPRLIAMTANAMVGDRDECYAAGMHDYVAKPVQAAELEAALRRAIEHRVRAAGT